MLRFVLDAVQNEKLTEFRDRLKELKVLKRTHGMLLLCLYGEV